jgi:uncharacterized protein (DUF58 family)
VSPVRIEVTPNPPSLASKSGDTDDTLVLRPGEQQAAVAPDLAFPLAGTFRLERPSITVSDRRGLFVTSACAESSVEVELTPAEEAPVRTAVAGDKLTDIFGKHRMGLHGAGFEFVELREYASSDSLRHIDWNTTARLNEPYVREFEARTDFKIALVVDCRPSMSAGPRGRGKFQHVREIALRYLDRARRDGMPIGLYAVGENGLATTDPPAASANRYRSVRERLNELEPPEQEFDARGDSASRRSPGEMRRCADRLQRSESAFASRLQPFFATYRSRVEQIRTMGLYRAYEEHVGRLDGTVLSVVLTDDANRDELEAVVKRATRNGDSLHVFLAPSVLFEGRHVVDAEYVYGRYADFRAYRRELSGANGIDVFEVSPDWRSDGAPGRNAVANGGRS